MASHHPFILFSSVASDVPANMVASALDASAGVRLWMDRVLALAMLAAVGPLMLLACATIPRAQRTAVA